MFNNKGKIENVLSPGGRHNVSRTVNRSCQGGMVGGRGENEFFRGTEEMHNRNREGVGGSFWPTLGNRRGDDTHSNDAAADLGEVLHVEDRGRINYSSIQKGGL